MRTLRELRGSCTTSWGTTGQDGPNTSFSTYSFLLLFLPLVLAVFYLLRKKASRPVAVGFLIFASCIFYAVGQPWYLLLLGASAGCNYVLWRRLQLGCPERKRWLVLGIVANCLVLAIFKYLDFGIANLNSILRVGIPTPRLLLPLGISFLTFQQIAFLVDTYRGKVHWVGGREYALTTLFFPKLLAGPIVRHDDLAPQFARLSPAIPWLQIAQGSVLLVIGLFKKAVIADSIAPWANSTFDTAAAGGDLTVWAAWLGVFAFTLQLYFDFSGYCDMALGIGHMFGVRLPINFDSPYKSSSISEFWRRWNMTLGAFIRDYLYIPLGGNRHGTIRMAVNLVLSMLIAGLWHGAGWGFVAWGGLHGIYLAGHALLRRTELPAWPKRSRLGRLIGWGVTFFLVMIAWVPFRAPDLATAGRMFDAMFDVGSLSAAAIVSKTHVVILVALLALTLAAPNPVRWVRRELPRFNWQPNTATLAAALLMLLAGIVMAGRIPVFIYFAF